MKDVLDDALACLLRLHSQTAPRLSSDIDACSPAVILKDARLVPAYACVISLLFLGVKSLITRFGVRKANTSRELSGVGHAGEEGTGTNASWTQKLRSYVKTRGGWMVVGLHVVRLVFAVALSGLSLWVLVIRVPGEKGHNIENGWPKCMTWPDFALAGAYVYSVIMSVLALTIKSDIRRRYRSQATLILFLQFCVFGWRNLLPLTTVHGVPADAGEYIWTCGTLVTLVGLVIPAIIPREYIPVDPNNPAEEASPEQVASLLSYSLWTYMEPVVFRGYRKGNVPTEDLPPLPDTDWSANLVWAVDVMDPVYRRANGLKVRHLFFGLMEAFRWQYCWLALVVLLYTLIPFPGYIALNRLLDYMETGGRNTDVRPWVYIVALFLSPLLGSIFWQWYIFTASQMSVQFESMLTQLIFRHALRLRVVDESEAPAKAVPAETSAESGLSVPEDSVSEATSADESDDTTIVVASTTTRGPSASASGAPSETGRATPPLPPKKGVPPEPTRREAAEPSKHLAGRVNNMVGMDMGNIANGRDFVMLLIECPLKVGLSIWFLYAVLGYAALVGLALLIVTLPLPSLLTQKISKLQKLQMQKADARIQVLTESMNTIRMIKMFGWEKMIEAKIAEKRDEELSVIRSRKLWSLLLMNVNMIIPLLNMISVFAIYTLVMKKELDAARIFSSIPVFSNLRVALFRAIYEVLDLITAKVSLDRVSKFIQETNLLDSYELEDKQEGIPVPADVIGFHSASFTWAKRTADSVDDAPRNFILRIDNLIFKDNEINLIIGPTGCGKTSILMALLGEMHFQSMEADAWYSLPRVRGIAYAAQESWVQNETVKNNILFGEAFDADRYDKVIYQCGLLPDLKLFAAGDNTEVGEKGLTLSGGQKARVTLARAIYSRAGILLLDDVLSALDVHTARWVVENCFRGDLVTGRTVILVTHAIALAGPISGNVISVDPHGRILSQGPLQASLSSNPALEVELREEAEAEAAVDVADVGDPGKSGTISTGKSDGKLVAKEEMAEGRLGKAAIKLLWSSFGGAAFWTAIILAFLVSYTLDILGTWWLGVWASAYAQPDVSVPYYLTVFVLLGFSQILLTAAANASYALVSVVASRRLHAALAGSVLGATMRWLDQTPVGRIISRFTQDIREIDSELGWLVPLFIRMTLSMMLKFCAVMLFSPAFIGPGLFVLLAGYALGHVYLMVQMCLKRLRSNSKSPIYSHFGAAVAGIVSVRAYGVERTFQEELRRRIDAYSRPSRTFFNLNRWVAIRMDSLGALFSSGLAAYLLYVKTGVTASNTGLVMAVQFADIVLGWVRNANMLEVSGNSLERLRDYINADQEPKTTEKGKPPAYWPSSGALIAEDLCARYSADGPLVLQGITFGIKSGERVGIVGRTGSGKSSLALSLLRLIPTTGTVRFDGLPIQDINLDALRTNLTIIPQEPMLVSGTLRSNVDPFSEHDDAALYDALRASGLVGRTGGGHDGKDLTLDVTVSHGGSNFSVGQRQLIALARAILRGAKVLILDEATASVDAETDTLIQESIRHELKHATLLTIAHRLQTIMDYDKIMVLDAGKLVEFDTPLALLANEKGMFRALVDESGHPEKLWELARKERS